MPPTDREALTDAGQERCNEEAMQAFKSAADRALREMSDSDLADHLDWQSEDSARREEDPAPIREAARRLRSPSDLRRRVEEALRSWRSDYWTEGFDSEHHSGLVGLLGDDEGSIRVGDREVERLAAYVTDCLRAAGAPRYPWHPTEDDYRGGDDLRALDDLALIALGERKGDENRIASLREQLRRRLRAASTDAPSEERFDESMLEVLEQAAQKLTKRPIGENGPLLMGLDRIKQAIRDHLDRAHRALNDGEDDG